MILYCFLSIILVSSAISGDVCLTNSTEIFTRSNGVFATRLYSVINYDDDENILLSPVGLNYVLTALSFGLGGNTLKELRSVLDQVEQESEISSSYRLFTKSLKGNKALKMATNIYIDSQFKVKEEFKKKTAHDFEAGFENVNFAGDTEGSRQIINTFVDNKTNHLIPELLEEGSVTEGTNAVIVNALYFKSEWSVPFKKEDTKKNIFYGLEGDYEVDMMQQLRTSYKYADDEELNAQIIEIPYKQYRFSFVIILPNERFGIGEVEEKLHLKDSSFVHQTLFIEINKVLNLKNVSLVDLYLPKFTFDHTYHLMNDLEKMGLNELLSYRANFTRLSDQQLSIDEVIQQTHITVDENGTEAAAATATTLIKSSWHDSRVPKQFNADHPFIFIIKDKETGIPLFIGRHTKPEI